QVPGRFTKGMKIRISENDHRPKTVEMLHEILSGYPGNCELQLVMFLADGSRAYLKCDALRLDVNPELRARVDDLLGPGNVQMVAAPPPTTSRPRPANRPREMAAS